MRRAVRAHRVHWRAPADRAFFLDVQVGKFEIGKTLGEGTFGKVKLAVNPETGEKVRERIERVCACGFGGNARYGAAVRACSALTRSSACSAAGGHQDPGQGEDPEAEHGQPSQGGGALRAARGGVLHALPRSAPHFTFAHQISIMKVVKHENIVKLHEVLASRTKVRRAARVTVPRPPRVARCGASHPRPLPADLHCARAHHGWGAL